MAHAAAILVLATCAAATYLAPSIIGYARAVPRISAVVKLNVLTGWTIAGWVRALRLATRRPPGPARRRPPSPPSWQSALAAGRLHQPGRAGSPPPLRLVAARDPAGTGRLREDPAGGEGAQ